MADALKVLALTLVFIPYCLCNYTVTLFLNEYNAGQGFLADGTHCNEFWNIGQRCNIRMKLALDLLSTLDGKPPCSQSTWIDLGNVTTNSNDVKFSIQTYGAWMNPMLFTASDIYKGFTLCVKAFEATSNQLIDSFQTSQNGIDIVDFTFYSHERNLLEPTMIGYAWKVTGDVPFPQPTASVPPIISSTIPSVQLITDCQDAFDNHIITTSDLVNITLPGNEQVEVYCEVDQGVALTVIQSRGGADSLAFETLNYEDYQKTQGDAGKDNNYWMGLNNMNLLSSMRSYDMSIIACCKNKMLLQQFYFNVTVGNKDSQFVLKGTAESKYGLGFSPPSPDLGRPFFAEGGTYSGVPQNLCTVVDPNRNAKGIGGWWFGNCADNLNGHYYEPGNAIFTDPNSCKIDIDKAGQADGSGFGIELNSGKGGGATFIEGISYTRVRMALYRTGMTAPSSTDFCS